MLDTNVLLSGIFFGGVPGRVLNAWGDGQLELVLSPDILAEYGRAGEELARKYPTRAEALGPVLALISMHATLVDAPPLIDGVSADADDDKFLAAAEAADAHVVVSGDQDLLDVSGWRGISVLTPRAFVDRHLTAG